MNHKHLILLCGLLAPISHTMAQEELSQRPKSDLTPGYALIDGDIQVPIEELDRFLQDPSQKAVFGNVNFWNGVVPFDFDGNVTASQQQAAIDAMSEIETFAGVDFRPREGTDPDWIRFQDSDFNSSPVGRRGGMQIINIFNWGYQIIIIHEVYHSLGFWHEQSANDRDTYVTIIYDNICGSSDEPADPCHPNSCQSCVDGGGDFISCAHNFDIESYAGLWGPYDFESMMHYGPFAFSCTGAETIVVNEPWHGQYQSVIGQRSHVSLIDQLSCRGIYPYTGDRWLRDGAGGSDEGTFFNPFRGAFDSAFQRTPANGTLLVDPGSYSGIGTFSEAKTIRATYGLVVIGGS